MAFDISNVLKGVSDQDTREQITYIALDSIDPDPDNFYSLDGLGDLAENIEFLGLQQPLRVRPGSEPGRYTIISGHRRKAAAMLIRDGGSHQFDGGIACIVDYGNASAAMRELQLIYANASTRVLTPAEMSKQAERVETLLYQLKEEGVEFPGRMRDHVAQACQVSRSKIARLHAIRKNLAPEILDVFDRGSLNESVAYRISQEPKTVQHELFTRTGPTELASYQLKDTEDTISVIKAPRTEPMNRTPAKEDAGWDVDAYLANRHREDLLYFENLKKVAHGFLKELGGGYSRNEGIEFLKKHFGSVHLHSSGPGRPGVTCMPKGLELYSPDSRQLTRTWTEVYDMLATIAIDELRTVREGQKWSTGNPTERGTYVIRCGAGLTEEKQTACTRTSLWDGSGWVKPASGASEMNKVYRWYKIPEV